MSYVSTPTFICMYLNRNSVSGLIFVVCLMASTKTTAQSRLKLSVSTKKPWTINNDALLELDSPKHGLLLSRVSLSKSTTALPLSSFNDGMMVFNTDTTNDVIPGLYIMIGGAWRRVATQTPLASIDFYTKEVIKVPTGTSDERAAIPEIGMIRFNTTINKFEGFNGTIWTPLN